MQEAYINSNPLIRSAVHRSLVHAINEIGLPEFRQETFMKEIAPYLKAPDSIFEDTETELTKLWKSILHGEVFAVDIWNDQPVFYVRGGLVERVMDIRLLCGKDEWHVESVVSMYHRPVFRSPLFYRAAFIGAIIVAGLIGYAVHRPGHAVQPANTTAPAVVQTTPNNGTQAGNQTSATTSTQTSNRTTAHTTASNQTNTTSTTNTTNSTQKSTTSTAKTTSHKQPPKPKTQSYTFTLSEGMPLDDISQFLKTHGFIKSAIDFDMLMKKTKADQDLRPGKYTFKSGMSQSQLIAVLKNGPQH